MKTQSNGSVMIKMIGFVKPLTGWMFLAIMAGIIGFLCAILIPFIAAILVVQVLINQVFVAYSTLFIVMLICAVLRGILHYLEQACNHFIAFRLLALLRDHVFSALRRLCPAKLEGEDRGNLIAVITGDIELLEVFYAHTISPVVIAILTSLLLCFVFLFFHPLFALIALLGYVTVGLLLPLFIMKKGRLLGQALRNQNGKLGSTTLETIRGFQEILQYDGLEDRIKQIQQESHQFNYIAKQLKRVEGLSQALANAALMSYSLIMLVTGLVLMQMGQVSLVVTLLATVLMISSFGPVLALSSLSNNLLVTLASARRVFNLLEEREEVCDIQGQANIEFGDVSVNSITFGYGQEDILNQFSAQFPTGQITGIFGKSGSGKSTLLKLCMRFWKLNQGKIEINGTNLEAVNTANLREFQSYVTQDTILFQDTLEHNIRLANQSASEEEVHEACRQANLHDWIMQLPQGYQSQVSELGESLSGGERQRIALARSFLHKSDFILLDEPTSNLDALNEATILQSLQAQKGKTILLVSHRASTMKIAKTVLSVESGRAS